MNWNNASIDDPPPNGQQVIICVNGVYHLAAYLAREDMYRLVNDPETVFDPKEHLIYWMLNYQSIRIRR